MSRQNPKTKITVETIIRASAETVWKYWTRPADIVRWNAASDDWHTTRAINDLRAGGRFVYRMEAKDGSSGFDFGGIYDKAVSGKEIEYTLDDGRKVSVTFSGEKDRTKVIETFEAETENSVELQRLGWQAILNNFKKYVEAQK